jgi:hypothetical protein
MIATNIAVSVRQRLLNYAKQHREDYQRVLTRYAIERLLFRLSRTEARDTYVLKGAMLFVTWPAHVFRPTGDLDLLGQGDPTPEAIIALFTSICSVACPEDGVLFDGTTLKVEPVREDEKYQGVRLSLMAELARAKIPMQVDIGFGDRVHPAPARANFPKMLGDLPAANVLMYPPATVIAEKFEAMVRFGEANTRIKDFYDIWVTLKTFGFDLATIADAVGGTLRRRETDLPSGIPPALTAGFAAAESTQALWSGFLRRTPPTLAPPAFADLLAELRTFFAPVIEAIALPESAVGRWDQHRGSWGAE